MATIARQRARTQFYFVTGDKKTVSLRKSAPAAD